MHLWTAYTVLFVLLALMIPCLWVAYIWDQIIDPHYESDNIAIPEHRLLRAFYTASKRITTQFCLRTPIFVIVSLLFVVTAVIDVVRELENPVVLSLSKLPAFCPPVGYHQMPR